MTGSKVGKDTNNLSITRKTGTGFALSPIPSAILILTLASVLTIADSFIKCAGTTGVVLIIAFICNWDKKGLVKRLAVINIFSLFILGTFAISAWSGNNLLKQNLGLGLHPALLLCLKLNLLGAGFFIVFHNIDVSQVASIMKKFHVPHKLALLITSSWRNISVIEKQYESLQLAAELRCYRPSLNRHTYETIGNHIGMTLILSWLRTKRISNAMALRGFTGKLPLLNVDKATSQEKLFLVMATILTIFPLFL